MYLMIVYIYIYIQYPLFISKSMYMNIFVNYISTFKREKGVSVYISSTNILILNCRRNEIKNDFTGIRPTRLHLYRTISI